MLACPACRKLYPSDASKCVNDGHDLVPLDQLPEEDPPLERDSMVGEYRVEKKLGSGTFGAVYAAEQPLIGKKVAIKLLHKKFASDAGVVSRFVSEARAVNRIRHKNIIDIFSFGVLEGSRPYFVMDLLDGMTVRELLDHEGRIPVAEAIPILRGIAEGLDAAHEAGVTHRDLKPDNIFLAIEKAGGYLPKLLDFGVAKLVADGAAHKTSTGAAIGTPSYMAPEQCRGQPVDHRADIYALGVVIHEMLTGKRLFQADSAMDVLIKHVNEPPRPMSEVCPELPRELDAPVLAMLAKKPRARPSSAGAAVAALVARVPDGKAGGAAAAAKAEPGSFERALARREADTITIPGRKRRDRGDEPAPSPAGVAVASTPSEEGPAVSSAIKTAGPALEPVAERESTSYPPALDGTLLPDAPEPPPEGAEPAPETPAAGAPNAPAMSADGRFAISSKGNTIKVWDLRTGRAIHTFQGQPGAVPVPPSDKAEASVRGAPAKPATRKAGARTWAVLGVGAALLAAGAWRLETRTPAPPLATAEPNPAPSPGDGTSSNVTLRLAVTPSDADVMLDGLRAGKASEPLVLPRSSRRCALRIEKRGFETQTLWVVPDHDSSLPPVVLRAEPEPTSR